jgi:hypothetical protein
VLTYLRQGNVQGLGTAIDRADEGGAYFPHEGEAASLWVALVTGSYNEDTAAKIETFLELLEEDVLTGLAVDHRLVAFAVWLALVRGRLADAMKWLVHLPDTELTPGLGALTFWRRWLVGRELEGAPADPVLEAIARLEVLARAGSFDPSMVETLWQRWCQDTARWTLDRPVCRLSPTEA